MFTPSDMPIRQRFGSWSQFLDVMGLKPIKVMPYDIGITRKGCPNKKHKTLIVNGYQVRYNPNHPTADVRGYCRVHRMVAWDTGLLTNLNDVVHHRDGNKHNNTPDNLRVISNNEHTSLHCKGRERPRRNRKPCLYPGCNEMTGSAYELCTKHYKSQWRRVNEGCAENLHDFTRLGSIHDREVADE